MHFIQLQFPELTRTIRDHSFNTYAKNFRKTKISSTISGNKKCYFLENLTYILHGRSLSKASELQTNYQWLYIWLYIYI